MVREKMEQCEGRERRGGGQREVMTDGVLNVLNELVVLVLLQWR